MKGKGSNTRTAVVVRHVHFEDLRAFAAPIEAAGYSIQMLDAGASDFLETLSGADASDLLVILGGPIGAYDENKYPILRGERWTLEKRLQVGRPTLGICLGAQLIALASGSGVHAIDRGAKEIGWGPISLTPAGERSPLRHLGNDVAVLHWHGDTYDLPTGADLLASTAFCYNQAFAFGRHALALQFHSEVSEVGFERWLIGHAAEIGAAGIDPRVMRADAIRFGQRAAGLGRRMIAEWLDGLTKIAQTY